MRYRDAIHGEAKRRKARKNRTRPLPKSAEIRAAIERYLNNGGTIKVIEPLPTFDEFMKYQPERINVDSFLMGEQWII